MPDREKVIRQWEGIIDQIKQGKMRRPIATTLVYDTLVLLIAQDGWNDETEPVKPTWRREYVFCGKCGRQYGCGFKYCPDCGRRIKWEVSGDA